MNQQKKEKIAEELFQSEKQGVEVDQFSADYPNLTAEVAYDIQSLLVKKKLADEDTKFVGRKLGLTSEAKMKQMNVDAPIYGSLLANMECSPYEPISLEPFIHPKIEPEIAFIFNKDIKGPHVTIPQVLEATAYITPALEIIDSRYRDFTFTFADVIADNASSSRYVIGSQYYEPQAFDLSLMGMVFKKNGEIVSTGTGAAVMGHPARAIAWMANKLDTSGESIGAGEIVLSGALGEAITIDENDVISLSFDGIGSVNATFTR